MVAAYQIGARTHLRSGGTLRFSGFADQPLLDLAGVRFGGVPERLGVPPPPPEPSAPPPRQVTAGDLSCANRAAVEEWCAGLGIPLLWQDTAPPRGADDVVIAGTPPGDEWMAQMFADLPRHAVVSVHAAAGSEGRRLACDIGRIHYQGIRVVGRGDGSVAQRVRGEPRAQGLAPGVDGRGSWAAAARWDRCTFLLALSQPRSAGHRGGHRPVSAERLAALGERVAAHWGCPRPTCCKSASTA